jgi:hypothetical protein
VNSYRNGDYRDYDDDRADYFVHITLHIIGPPPIYIKLILYIEYIFSFF